MKKIFTLCLPVLALILPACQTLGNVMPREPVVSFNTVDITGVSFTGVDMAARVDIENPNGFAIPLPYIEWELFIDGNSFIKGSLPAEASIDGRSAVTLDLPFGVTYEGLFRSFAALLENNEAAYKIALELSFDLPIIGTRVHSLEFEGTIPVLRVPELSFVGIELRHLSLFAIEFAVNLEINNRNGFAMGIGEFNYDFSVNNARWAQGRINNPPEISANSRTAIPITVGINALSMVRELTDIIMRGADVNYSFGGNMSLSGGLPGLQLDMPLDMRGSTRILR